LFGYVPYLRKSVGEQKLFLWYFMTHLRIQTGHWWIQKSGSPRCCHAAMLLTFDSSETMNRKCGYTKCSAALFLCKNSMECGRVIVTGKWLMLQTYFSKVIKQRGAIIDQVNWLDMNFEVLNSIFRQYNWWMFENII